jgi:hypothetical protein
LLDRCGLPRLSARPPTTLPAGGAGSSSTSVKMHVKNFLENSIATSRTEALAVAARRGLITFELPTGLLLKEGLSSL